MFGFFKKKKSVSEEIAEKAAAFRESPAAVAMREIMAEKEAKEKREETLKEAAHAMGNSRPLTDEMRDSLLSAIKENEAKIDTKLEKRVQQEEEKEGDWDKMFDAIMAEDEDYIEKHYDKMIAPADERK